MYLEYVVLFMPINYDTPGDRPGIYLPLSISAFHTAGEMGARRLHELFITISSDSTPRERIDFLQFMKAGKRLRKQPMRLSITGRPEE
jgi:hypothetical protein